MHDRFRFLSAKKDELIQFQADRLLHNWRKVGDGSNTYPRFEKMIESFETELQAFESYISSLASQKLTINQCEVSYINHIVWVIRLIRDGGCGSSTFRLPRSPTIFR